MTVKTVSMEKLKINRLYDIDKNFPGLFFFGDGEGQAFIQEHFATAYNSSNLV
jgi:hypothetical protein